MPTRMCLRCLSPIHARTTKMRMAEHENKYGRIQIPFGHAVDQGLSDIVTISTHARRAIALYGTPQACSSSEKAVHTMCVVF